MGKKQYQKPIVEKVNLRVTESVLTACKTTLKQVQPTVTNSACGPPANKCLGDVGS
jgi:hypothetical protein